MLASQTAVQIYLSLCFVWRRNTALKVLVFHKNNIQGHMYICIYIYNVCILSLFGQKILGRAKPYFELASSCIRITNCTHSFIPLLQVSWFLFLFVAFFFHPRESIYMQIQSFQHPWMVSNGNWTCCASTHRKDYLGKGNDQNHLIRCMTFERYTTLVHLDMQTGTRRGVVIHVISINRSMCLRYKTASESTVIYIGV